MHLDWTQIEWNSIYNQVEWKPLSALMHKSASNFHLQYPILTSLSGAHSGKTPVSWARTSGLNKPEIKSCHWIHASWSLILSSSGWQCCPAGGWNDSVSIWGGLALGSTCFCCFSLWHSVGRSPLPQKPLVPVGLPTPSLRYLCAQLLLESISGFNGSWTP